MKRNSASVTDADERGPSSSKGIRLYSDLPSLANYYGNESNIKSNKLNATETENQILLPISRKIKVDSNLKYTSDRYAPEFNKKNKVKQHIKNILENRLNVDQFKRETSYLFPYNMCWKFLITAENNSWGNGYFGATFWHPEREQVVIAHRGITPSKIGAVWTDIIGIYGNIVPFQISSAVTFTHHVQHIFAEVDKERGTHFKIFITGHSLGAWLAQVCTFSLKYLTIMDDNTYFVKSKREGHHAHTVVFDSPGCKPMLQQLQREFDVRYDNVEKLPIDSLDITSYLSAPNRFNTCNPHVGKIYRVFIDFDNESFFNEYNLQTHSLDNILKTFDKDTGLFKKENSIFKIQEVVDWPETSILKRDEYDEFFEWAKKLNNYHPTSKEVIFKDYCKIRYQTKEFNKRQCSLNVFSQSEQQFLKQYQSVRQYSDFFNLNKLFNKEHLEILNKLSIDESNRLVSINKGSIVELYNTISYIKQLLIKYPEKSKILKTWVSEKSIVEKLYKDVSNSYLDMNKNWLKFKGCENIKIKLLEFLKNSNKIVWKVDASNGDTFCTLKQVYNTFLAKFKNESIFNYTKKHCIVLDLKYILLTNRYIKMLNFLKSTKSYKQLLIIEYNPNQADNNDDLVKKFFTNLFEEIKSFKSCKIILCAKQDHILNNILKTRLDKLYIETKDEGFTWNDLDVESQTVILKRKIVFQEKEINLEELIDKFNIKNKIDQLIDHDTLVKLINNDNKIEIKSKNFGIKNLEGAYADLYKQVNNETLKENLINNLIEAVYFISGLFENYNENKALDILANNLNFEINTIADKTNYLKSPYFFQFNDNKYIYLVDSQFKEEDFNKLCDNHFNDKKMFWIKLDNKKFILQRLYNPDFYIKRKFHSVLLNINKEMFETSECFVFSGVDCVETLAILFDDSSIKNNKNIYIKQISEDAVLTFNRINGIVHWIEVKTIESNNQLIWRDSKGSIHKIRQYINHDVKLLEDEDSLVNLIENKQTIIIADDPGMGKSTTLVELYYSKLKNNINLIESNWIIHVNLRDHIQTIKSYFNDNNFNIDIIIKFFSKIDLKLSNNILQNLLKYTANNCTHMSLLISFDGFDDLHDSKDRSKIMKLSKFLRNYTKVKIWITTRMHYCKDLENTLSTIAIKFSPMDKQSIKLFIVEYLKVRLSLILDYQVYKSIFVVEKNEFKFINKFTEQFLIKMESLFKGDISRFIGTPLQLHLLLGAKGFIDNFVQWTYNTKQSFNFDYLGIDICSVYEYFIDNKYDILFKKMCILSYVVRKQFKNQLNDYCVGLAAESIFSIVSNKNKTLKSKELFLSLGLIQTDERNNLKFIHCTFDEYYASEKCINWIEQNDEFDIPTKRIKFVLQVLKNENYRNIRSFINIKLNKLKNDITNLDKIYKQYGTIINTEINLNHSNLLLNQKGYTALDLAAEEGNLNIVNFLLTSCKKFENGLVKKLIFTKKNILKMNALHIAVYFNNVEIFNKLITLFDNAKDTFFELVNDKDLGENSILHSATKNKNNEIIEKLISLFDSNNNKLIEWIKDKNKTGESILHLAMKYNNFEIIEKLILLFDKNKNELFELIKDKNQDGDSVLHLAAQYKSVETIEKLIPLFDNNKNELIEWIKDKNKTGESILHLAVKYNNIEIMEKLILLFDNNKNELNEYIKDKNNYGDSVLHLAVKYNNIEIIEKLIPFFDSNKNELIEWIKDKNNYGDSVLHLAVKYNNIEIIEKLIPLFDNNKNELLEWIRNQEQDGNSLLHLALKYNNIEVIKELIPLFDNNKNELIEWIKDKNKNNESVLHLAVKKNNIEFFDKLILLLDSDNIDFIKLIKDKNQDGHSFLDLAIWTNNIEIIEKLFSLFYNNKNELIEWIKNKNKNHHSIIHLAILNNNIEVIDRIFSLLNDKNNELVEWVKDKNKVGDSVLHLAVKYNSLKIIEKFIQLFDGKNNKLIEWIKDKNKNGDSILHLAVRKKNIEIIERLIPLIDSNNNDFIELIKDKNRDDNSILHSAILNNNIEIIEKIIILFNSNNNEFIKWVKNKNQNEDSILQLAVRKNNIEIIEKLIPLFDNSKNEFIKWMKNQNKNGDSLLHLSTRKNNIEIIEKLISLFDNNKNEFIKWIKNKNQNGDSLLHIATRKNNIEIIEKLIPLFNSNKNELIEWIRDKNQNGDSLLHIAARKNSIEIIEKLIPLFNSNKNELIKWIRDKNQNGDSLLHLATRKNNIEIIEKLILVFNSNKNELIEWIRDENQNGDSLLHLAMKNNNFEIIKLLIPLFDGNNNELIKWFKNKNKDGDSVLHLAARKNNIEIIEKLILLINSNKNELIEWIRDENQNGDSLLHLAVKYNNFEIIKSLIPLFDGNNNELIKWVKEKNRDGDSVLHLAALISDTEVIERLISLLNGNNNQLIEWINFKNQDGDSVLHLAVKYNNFKIIKKLIPLFDGNNKKLIEWIKNENKNGESILHLAMKYNNFEIIEKLIPLFNSNKNELIKWIRDKNKYGDSVLHLAVKYNNFEIIEKLIPLFDNNNNELIEWMKAKNQDGNSVLHLTALINNVEVIDKLIPMFDSNTNELIEWVKDKNQDGNTVLHLAILNNNVKIIDKLIPMFDNNKNELIKWIKDKNQNGDSLLHLAALINNVEVVGKLYALLDNNKNKLIEWIKDKNQNGNSVLHLSALINYFEVIKKLISLLDGNNYELIECVKDKNQDGDSVLHLAVKYNNFKIIDSLISLFDGNKIELINWVKEKNKDGDSVLHIAAFINNVEVIEKLISFFDGNKNELIKWVKDQNKDGDTVLHLAVKYNNFKIIEKLILLFDNKNNELIEWIKDKNNYGDSVLHLAVKYNNFEIIEKLISLFNNKHNELIEWIKEKNKDGYSVSHLAALNNVEVIEKLTPLFDNDNNESIEKNLR
ncbi:hypothetical protein BLOT_012458 [Blomia tropicalis]|nr:hypothetical protein BLOT_012458 [Blomia tropicalis]